jgi:pyruvate/2-oxoglutarate dehydrogenase complex dihydrolipoamide acyltransferase (E2) component
VTGKAVTGAALHVPRHRHSPRVRRLAKEAGIDDLDAIEGTGPNGRVRPGDIVTRPVTYIADFDLAAVPNALEDRQAVVAAAAYALLRAVRRHQPITDIEVVSGGDRILIPRAHDLTRAAIADRLQITGPASAATTLSAATKASAATTGSAALTITDSSETNGVLRVAPPRPGCLISAVIGPTTVRPTTHPGLAGFPSIEFHPTALLAVSTNDARLSDSVVALLTRIGGN